MTLEDQINRLIRINDLIRRKGTGTTEDLAIKLGISIRQCQRLIKALKNMGSPIEYSKGNNSFYFFKENGRFVICEWIENPQEVKHSNNGKPTYSNE